MFFINKYFFAENVSIYQLFLHITVIFYKHSVFFLGGVGGGGGCQTQYAYDFPKLSRILCL